MEQKLVSGKNSTSLWNVRIHRIPASAEAENGVQSSKKVFSDFIGISMNAPCGFIPAGGVFLFAESFLIDT